MKIFTYPSAEGEKRVKETIDRGLGFSDADYRSVEKFISDVKNRGDEAVLEYTQKFDSHAVTHENFQVPSMEFERARALVDDSFLKALDRAVDQLESFHSRQRENSWIHHPRRGVTLGQLVRPVSIAGIYAPGAKGGKTPLVSSVLMGAVPAKVAGVESTILMTPPMADGTVNPYMLAAAERVGINLVFKAGSAWAIAAMAYGTAQVPKVDVVVGPGNIYVTLAKKIVSGTVGIDMIAGPSEILIIADQDADPRFIAADLLSQAEHDTMASSILVTDSRELALGVAGEVERQLDKLSRKETALKSIEDFGAIMVVPDIDTAVSLSNRLAPEHLELMVKEPFQYIGEIKNAGALFIGPYTPEPVGDYIAGPNHVLPTAGTARFSSALSVDVFMKKISLINYSKEAFENEARDILTLAGIEGLDAHANSIRIRMD
ncbi:MAG: histidinol dehydrogenase [Desulfamplus sp.]|nr:histidinol dehydrogenase [Desulfamplus sp.]